MGAHAVKCADERVLLSGDGKLAASRETTSTLRHHTSTTFLGTSACPPSSSSSSSRVAPMLSAVLIPSLLIVELESSFWELRELQPALPFEVDLHFFERVKAAAQEYRSSASWFRSLGVRSASGFRPMMQSSITTVPIGKRAVISLLMTSVMVGTCTRRAVLSSLCPGPKAKRATSRPRAPSVAMTL